MLNRFLLRSFNRICWGLSTRFVLNRLYLSNSGMHPEMIVSYRIDCIFCLLDIIIIPSQRTDAMIHNTDNISQSLLSNQQPIWQKYYRILPRFSFLLGLSPTDFHLSNQMLQMISNYHSCISTVRADSILSCSNTSYRILISLDVLHDVMEISR